MSRIKSAQIAAEIATERQRQIEKEGYDHEHDDHEHRWEQLADAAACYAHGGFLYDLSFAPVWPWAPSEFRGSHPRRKQLVIAAALIVAEIERMDRKQEAVA